jgi:hypothetical protein
LKWLPGGIVHQAEALKGLDKSNMGWGKVNFGIGRERDCSELKKWFFQSDMIQ